MWESKMQVLRWNGQSVGHPKKSQCNLHFNKLGNLLSKCNKLFSENDTTTGKLWDFLNNDDLCFSVLQGLLSVLIYGILFYPFFACLTTKHKLIGSLMGFLYAAIRYEAVYNHHNV